MATQLTDSQRRIKELLDRGMGAREIAEQLGISRNAVYQQIQRMRKHGVIEPGWTPTGMPARQAETPGEEVLAKLLNSNGNTNHETQVAGALALVQELRQVRDELDAMSRRISSIVPR